MAILKKFIPKRVKEHITPDGIGNSPTFSFVGYNGETESNVDEYYHLVGIKFTVPDNHTGLLYQIVKVSKSYITIFWIDHEDVEHEVHWLLSDALRDLSTNYWVIQ